MLASISHDIRSPLTSIRAYVDGLLDGIADTKEKQKAYLGIIQKKTSEIDQMVKKLFLFSKMDIGEYQMCIRDSILPVPVFRRRYIQYRSKHPCLDKRC